MGICTEEGCPLCKSKLIDGSCEVPTLKLSSQPGTHSMWMGYLNLADLFLIRRFCLARTHSCRQVACGGDRRG
jgi:hypothetical protein